jgi:hypothetical protein
MDAVIERPKVRETVAGVVVVHGGDPPQPADGHEAVTRAALAREIAALKGFAFAGEYDTAFAYPGGVYHVPRDTIVGADAARALGIASERDLFGGVVPHAFVATKTICHPLVEDAEASPPGWSHAFAEAVAACTLEGRSAFSERDAIVAGTRLLANGPVRVKRALGIGGRGQEVVATQDELRRAIASLDRHELATFGVSLERNLRDVATWSVGRVRVGPLVASYYGTQRLTTSNGGHAVYGGSDLVVARGGFDVLLSLDVPDDARRAIRLALRFDAAAVHHYRGLIVSRRNYDVAQGSDADGRPRCGVLEQSWRLGGASGAEIGALAAFAADASLVSVRASTVEIHGEGAVAPGGATVHFRGDDPRAGPLLKYSLVEPHVDAR